MMKEIRIILEDKEYNKCMSKKGDRTWKEYFMNGCGEDGSNNKTRK